MEKGIQGVGSRTQVFRELDDRSEKYVILSHRWGEEVNYDEMTRFMEMGERCKNEVRQRVGYEKIIKSCKQALQDGYRWIWIDTCCIDKRSSSELSEAINSMFRWYRKSQKCYVYLNDVGGAFFPNERDLSKFTKANGWPEWFSRGWTLQELIAPKQVEFFNKDWVFIGSKQDLADTLEKITRIPIDVLKDGLIPRRVCVAGIMSWAADRKTMRVEDRAYSLLGLFGVNMPILYGEGAKAFHRLQLEIIRASGDQSIFAWNPKGQFGWVGSVLAGDPGYFRGCHDIEKVESDELVDELMKYTRRNRLGIARMPDFGSNLACLRSRGLAFRQQLSVFLVTNSDIGLSRLLWKLDHHRLEIPRA
ncbi:hypothetical protein M404DRAFT_239875 [Pisolithus tinctorius Marx 270]|uniref:Uncharacterized protein n=1 Tax=Pisolithus tinctorius Marx 270 TaxID=870435 RepID=A0A0C3N6B0_PISTI|nr:hypothetical protein M404DRAFT_239875 [Pisolithus tinctorius Marx 270]